MAVVKETYSMFGANDTYSVVAEFAGMMAVVEGIDAVSGAKDTYQVVAELAGMMAVVEGIDAVSGAKDSYLKPKNGNRKALDALFSNLCPPNFKLK